MNFFDAVFQGFIQGLTEFLPVSSSGHLAICQHISSLDYLGLDIIITEDGMKLCEINTHPALDYEQILCGPVLLKDNARKFFESKGINNYDCDKLWQAYLQCQY